MTNNHRWVQTVIPSTFEPCEAFNTNNVKHEVLHGDALERLRALPSNSVDSLVTDPPAGIAFMNSEWDKDRGGRDQWIEWLTAILCEVFRVLKPGAHGLVWAMPRTAHWTAMALENAGFLIRDQIMHVFVSGMPKSRNVSLDVDKLKGVKSRVVGTWKPTGSARPEKGKKGHGNKATAIHDVERENVTLERKAPSSDEGKAIEGCGTGLKPAHEVWWLVMKPMKTTIAQNVLQHGTGVMRIDACRVESNGVPYAINRFVEGAKPFGNAVGCAFDTSQQERRWPANIVISHSEHCQRSACVDGCAVATLDAQAGKASKNKGRKSECFNVFWPDVMEPFVLCPKPSGTEKEAGLDDLQMTVLTDGRKKAIDNPRLRDKTKRRNPHPTVKPIALMRHFVRLVTPIGGLVLDPFLGSGTTMIACVHEELRCIGIEQSEEFASVARLRVLHAANGVTK